MRILSEKEVLKTGYYDELVELSRIFGHRMTADIEGKNEVWRWEEEVSKVKSIANIIDAGKDLNDLALLALTGKVVLEDYMKYYMQMGYSLSGYYEVFGQREVTEYELKYLSKPPKDWNFDEKYWQTPIHYMIKKYSGKSKLQFN